MEDPNTRRLQQTKPLAMAHFSPNWLLLGWCDERQDFRNYRLDKMMDLKVLSDQFTDRPGQRLQDFLNRESEKKHQQGHHGHI